MQYVTKVKVSGELAKAGLLGNEGVVAFVREVGGKEETPVIGHISDCYGISNRLKDGCAIAVHHSTRASYLYRHLRRAETEKDGLTVLGMYADQCSLSWFGDGLNNQNNCNSELDINLEANAVTFYKPFGSVVTVRDYFGKVQYYSLYDFLLMVCKKTGVNIMSYHNVIFYGSRCGASEVIFKHGRDDDVFFTKMWMEAKGA